MLFTELFTWCPGDTDWNQELWRNLLNNKSEYFSLIVGYWAPWAAPQSIVPNPGWQWPHHVTICVTNNQNYFNPNQLKYSDMILRGRRAESWLRDGFIQLIITISDTINYHITNNLSSKWFNSISIALAYSPPPISIKLFSPPILMKHFPIRPNAKTNVCVILPAWNLILIQSHWELLISQVIGDHFCLQSSSSLWCYMEHWELPHPGPWLTQTGFCCSLFTQHHNDVSLVHDHDTMVVDSLRRCWCHWSHPLRCHRISHMVWTDHCRSQQQNIAGVCSTMLQVCAMSVVQCQSTDCAPLPSLPQLWQRAGMVQISQHHHHYHHLMGCTVIAPGPHSICPRVPNNKHFVCRIGTLLSSLHSRLLLSKWNGFMAGAETIKCFYNPVMNWSKLNPIHSIVSFMTECEEKFLKLYHSVFCVSWVRSHFRSHLWNWTWQPEANLNFTCQSLVSKNELNCMRFL